MNNISRRANPLGGVNCVVDSCHYWGSGNHCHASSIEVKPPQASNSEETDCKTFRLKQ